MTPLNPNYNVWLEWQILLRTGRIPLHKNGLVNWEGFASKGEKERARELWSSLHE